MKPRYSLLSLAMMSALYSQYAQADLREQCLLGVPQFHGEAVDGNMNDQPIYMPTKQSLTNRLMQPILAMLILNKVTAP